MDRKRALSLIGAAVGIGTISTVVSRFIPSPKAPQGRNTIRSLPGLQVESTGEADILIRMQNELRRAMAKAMEERRWLMVIDTRKCVGCHACTVACIAENKLPPGVVYRPVITETQGKYPRQITRFFPRPCMQCDNPSCVSVCPVRATWKRQDGVVIVDYDRCIGCRYCLTACPYGARTSDFGNYYTEHTPEIQSYEKQPSNEYNKSWDRHGNHSPVGNARKCHFCLHRLEQGLLPQCVSTCVGRANYFGDANDATSLVAQMAKSANQIKLLEEKGTRPTVIYLV
jgi:molybdopterin-containing oxidoreductase family iron-sulfur binding subunit